jgi:hypothetical protein
MHVISIFQGRKQQCQDGTYIAVGELFMRLQTKCCYLLPCPNRSKLPHSLFIKSVPTLSPLVNITYNVQGPQSWTWPAPMDLVPILNFTCECVLASLPTGTRRVSSQHIGHLSLQTQSREFSE